jgi:hypothetical protein
MNTFKDFFQELVETYDSFFDIEEEELDYLFKLYVIDECSRDELIDIILDSSIDSAHLRKYKSRCFQEFQEKFDEEKSKGLFDASSGNDYIEDYGDRRGI